jgi:hypothetical protein
MVNAAGMVVAMVAIVWQIAAGVDYSPAPPGLIILAVAVAVVLRVQARWARIVGIGVPLFLAVGGTIASIANDDNALRHPSHAWPFVATVLQITAVGVALVAGVLALREHIAAEVEGTSASTASTWRSSSGARAPSPASPTQSSLPPSVRYAFLRPRKRRG